MICNKLKSETKNAITHIAIEAAFFFTLGKVINKAAIAKAYPNKENVNNINTSSKSVNVVYSLGTMLDITKIAHLINSKISKQFCNF